MGESRQADEQPPPLDASTQGITPPHADAAFHSQFAHLSSAPQDVSALHAPYNMGSMSHALPQSPHSPAHPTHQHTPSYFGGHAQQFYPMHPMQHGHPGVMGPAGLARAHQMQQQQQHYTYPPQGAMLPDSPSMRQMQVPAQYGGVNFAGSQASPGFAPDQRFANAGAFSGMPGAPGHFPHFFQPRSEAPPIPSFPRGPPRKPKQSGHALWVGNLPPAARIEDMKDHFSRDATGDIESVFLISKSNCAFVNYRSEAACSQAMSRFHDSRFHGVRLVCRLRRAGTSSSQSAGQASAEETGATGKQTRELEGPDGGGESSQSPPQDPDSPTIVRGGQQPSAAADMPASPADSKPSERVPDRYFIVKSLTVQDLESSTRTGVWATQNHNERAFNDAYQDSDNVYLIFSANKSGEYFGYARMASLIAGEPVNLNAGAAATERHDSSTPHAIETPATASAPKGRIIDDSARGTIFWEALREAAGTAADTENAPAEEEEGVAGSNWGRSFRIQWISTARLPFYRTRGLRNPWNAQREVKIARDGTQLEPGVGRRLVAMFHTPPAAGGGGGGAVSMTRGVGAVWG